MTAIIEPWDEINVFVSGTGCCFWGRILPTCRRARSGGVLGGVDLELTVEPLRDTVEQTRKAGVVFRDGLVEPLRGKKIHIPQRCVDVIFGDERHEAAIA